MHYGGVGEPLRVLLRQYVEVGRHTAMEEIVARTRARLLSVARRIGAAQDAEDAVQAAYLSLVRKREWDDAPILPWLITAHSTSTEVDVE